MTTNDGEKQYSIPSIAWSDLPDLLSPRRHERQLVLVTGSELEANKSAVIQLYASNSYASYDQIIICDSSSIEFDRQKTTTVITTTKVSAVSELLFRPIVSTLVFVGLEVDASFWNRDIENWFRIAHLHNTTLTVMIGVEEFGKVPPTYQLRIPQPVIVICGAMTFADTDRHLVYGESREAVQIRNSLIESCRPNTTFLVFPRGTFDRNNNSENSSTMVTTQRYQSSVQTILHRHYLWVIQTHPNPNHEEKSPSSTSMFQSCILETFDKKE